ncbi:GntR family transcriptional regulator [Alicyclobacillus tolerans]|uniref:GntR family transcriptional regulator n=1 Tax=Alicyclobacillus tolerans TaxID=90970 RepID=UPI001F4527C6|nr:GntR family transcriptional regulator [Alicyclobacillus tolerans]MCF8565603.1 GntR family transcriptional regulator [Alicyclobacillus tolerans]
MTNRIQEAENFNLPQRVLELPNYVPLRQAIYEALKSVILDGTLPPGQMLSENRLAESFSVSRTPIREAIRMLENDGLVTMLPGRKMIVSIPTTEDIREIHEIRSIIESSAVLKIKADNHELLEKLDHYVTNGKKLLTENNKAELTRNNTAFHMGIISVLRNRRVEQIMDSLHDAIARLRTYGLMEQEWATTSEEEHALIVESLKKGDQKQAAYILQLHIDKGRDVLLKMFSNIHLSK